MTGHCGQHVLHHQPVDWVNRSGPGTVCMEEFQVWTGCVWVTSLRAHHVCNPAVTVSMDLMITGVLGQRTPPQRHIIISKLEHPDL